MRDEDQNLLPEEEEELYTFTDDDGIEITFRELGRMDYKGSVYALLSLVDDESEGSVMVFTVDTDEDGEEILNPADEETGDEVFYLFLAENEDYEYGDAE